MGFVIVDNKRRIGQRGKSRGVGDALAESLETLTVENSVNLIGAGSRAGGQGGVGMGPAGTKLFIPSSLAEGAGTVTRGKRGGFIEKKQLCPTARLHQRPLRSLVLKHTDDPASGLVETTDAP